MTDQLDDELRDIQALIGERLGSIADRGLASSEIETAVSSFLAEVESFSPGRHYKSFSPRCIQIVTDLQLGRGVDAARGFLYSTMLAAMHKVLQGTALRALPPRLVAHQLGQYRRILAGTDTNSDWLDLGADFFHKEFGLASLRLFAAAAQVIDPYCGVPRSTFLKSGLNGIFRGVRLLGQTRGFSPMFQIHTHSRYLDEFNQQGWDECYRCCVDLYKVFPDARGMFGGSWFYDPQIREISPRLSYLQDIPLAGGAMTFFTASEGEHVQNALATSASRRQLHDEGRYQPKSYTLIWAADVQKAAVAGA